LTAAGTPDDRDVVPRWRQFGTTVRSGETAPLRAPRAPAAAPDTSETEQAFDQWPGPHTASDLVGAALVAGTAPPAALRAAKYLAQVETATPNMRRLAESLLATAAGETSAKSLELDVPVLDFKAVQARARELRRIVRAEPRNAVRWADLALAHTVLGHPEQAEREIRTALGLAGRNRFLLRAAVRLYVHLDQPDAAHALLVRDPTVLADPWLAAAELATAELAGHPSRYAKRARALVEDGEGIAPLHVAELASQVATAELRAGRGRHARRLMELALRDPTDNVLAQAEWASANGLRLDPASLDQPRTYEAQALRYSHEGEWEKAAAAGWDWLADQPFAQEPAQFTSYAASVGAEDWPLAQRAAEAGLRANPDDPILRNNVAFALANQDRPDEAAAHLAHINTANMTPRDAAVHRATEGLIAFRRGQTGAGRAAYSDAVASLTRAKQNDFAAIASVFWAREELRLGTDVAASVVATAMHAVKSASAPEASLWAQRLDDAASARSAQPRA
jgi:tetratricopeptide (TPR) repeat protein